MTTALPRRLAVLLLVPLLAALALAGQTTFVVQVPDTTPSGDTIYVAGDFQGWNPGHPSYALAPRRDGRWQITLALPDGQPVAFKFTRGSWATVEKGPSGEELPNRTHTPNGTESLDLVVASWADPAPTIVGHVEHFEHAPFLSGRRCWVYLPPGYDESTARYPVLYMHDGQNLFDDGTSFAGEWHVDEACEALIGAGEIEPLIVVGVENAGADRCYEYTAWPPSSPSGACPVGGGADLYLAALRDVLMPEVARRYRVKQGKDAAWMAGSSLGGLVSAYAGFRYDDTWGRVAALSPSYRWANRAMLDLAAETKPRGLARFYQDMGTREAGVPVDQDHNGVDDYVDLLRDMRAIALGQGFAEAEDALGAPAASEGAAHLLLSVEGQDHTHNEAYWTLRFPDVLRFLADPPRR